MKTLNVEKRGITELNFSENICYQLSNVDILSKEACRSDKNVKLVKQLLKFVPFFILFRKKCRQL